MKTKLRRFVSILSAMLLMICCAFPAFALKPSKYEGGMKLFVDMALKRINSDLGFTPDSYIAFYSPNRKEYSLVYLVPNSNQKFYLHQIGDKDTLNDSQFVISNYHSSSADNKTYRYVYQYNNKNQLEFYSNFNLYDFSADIGDTSSVSCGVAMHVGVDSDSGADTYVYYHAKIYDWSNPDKDLTPTDPNAPPVPFTVDYSPSLKTGLVRKGTLVAPGASNDGQEVETNTIAVTVKLTDAFLNASKPISGAYTYSYQFTCFVVPSEYKNSDIKTMSEHAIYTAAQDNFHYLYYENETLDVDDSLSSQPSTGELAPVSEQWANATGVSNCFLLERDNNAPLRNVTIDLHNIDFEKHKSDSYNIVVLGHIVRKSEYGWTAYPSFFKSDCSSLALESTKEYPMNFGSNEQPVINKNFYDYYSVISEDWSFKDYPKFEPHKVGGVTVGDSPLDFKRTAKGVQDYNMFEQGGTDNTLKPDDFDKYKEQKKLDKNFGSVDFGLDSIKSVFDGSSDFFKFLTASIGILPTTFLTILLSFFVVMLAICVVKWVLK